MRDWQGNPLVADTSFSLIYKDSRLLFHFQCAQKATYDPQARDNLWKMDVAELFIKDEKGEGYIEVNLAPGGAFWWARFKGPRQLVEENGPWPGVTTKARLYEDSWSVELSLPIELREGRRVNVNAIINHEGSEQYLSWTKLSPAQPDFHRPQEFLPALFVEI